MHGDEIFIIFENMANRYCSMFMECAEFSLCIYVWYGVVGLKAEFLTLMIIYYTYINTHGSFYGIHIRMERYETEWRK